MYVLHIVSDLDESFGGPSQSVPQLVKHLASEGVAGEIIYVETVKKSRNRIVEKGSIKAAGAKIKGSKNIYYAPDLKHKIQECIVKNSPDIIHIHSMWRYNAWVAWRQAKSHNIPFVVSPRSNLYAESLRKSWAIKKIARILFVNRMLKNAAFIHATAESEVNSVKDSGFGATPIIAISNGVEPVDLTKFQSKTEALNFLGLETDHKNPHILFLSRVDPRKRVGDLIEAFAKSDLCERCQAELVIAGPLSSEKYGDELRSRVDQLGIRSRVHFLGMLRDDSRNAAYKAADIFALPTEFENFGIAIGEALSAGLPVVTTTTTPWKTAQEKGAGYLVQPGDVQGLANGLNHFLERLPENREDISKWATLSAQPFTWSGVAKKMACAYKDIAEGENKSQVLQDAE